MLTETNNHLQLADKTFQCKASITHSDCIGWDLRDWTMGVKKSFPWLYWRHQISNVSQLFLRIDKLQKLLKNKKNTFSPCRRSSKTGGKINFWRMFSTAAISMCAGSLLAGGALGTRSYTCETQVTDLFNKISSSMLFNELTEIQRFSRQKASPNWRTKAVIYQYWELLTTKLKF